MAEVIRGSYKDIADAIRAKKGTSNEMTPAEMPAEIGSIIKPTGTKSITENGTGIDVTEYASVDVDVQGGGGPGSGIWWISDDTAYEPVNLATEDYEGWYNITTWSGGGSNPPEYHRLDNDGHRGVVQIDGSSWDELSDGIYAVYDYRAEYVSITNEGYLAYSCSGDHGGVSVRPCYDDGDIYLAGMEVNESHTFTCDYLYNSPKFTITRIE